jgi:hypothetical protein
MKAALVPVKSSAKASCAAKNGGAPTITTITVSKIYSRFI